METVPVISLDGRDGEIAAKIDRALREIGFFTIVDHGVPASVVERARKESRAFFDLPVEQKKQILNGSTNSVRGYLPIGGSALARTLGNDSPPDFKHSFGMGPIDVVVGPGGHSPEYYAPNVWPAGRDAFRQALEHYYVALDHLGNRLLRLFALGLDVAPDYFLERFKGHNSSFRVVDYPPQTTPPVPGQLRAGAHTDYGAFTILLGDDVPGGLQVQTRSGRWIDVPTPPDAFVINVGDMLMTWTNDVWVSTLHRVANPPAGAGPSARRMSMAFFANPREDVLIECLASCRGEGRPVLHAPVLAGDYRLAKIRASRPPAGA